MLQSKQGKAQRWISTQVLYGMDTSDPEPKNWKPFGELAEQLSAYADSKKSKADAKTD
jgi:hypothetical protein